jgi:hypothetical protein
MKRFVVVVRERDRHGVRGGKETNSVRDAIRDLGPSRATTRGAGREMNDARVFYTRAEKRRRLSATSDAIEHGAGGGRTSLPPWPSYTPKKAVSSSRPSIVACASCGRRPGLGLVSAG